jgi:hypothetical protein
MAGWKQPLVVFFDPVSLDGTAWRGSQAARAERPMDQRIELFLTDILALAGEDPHAVREGVRVALADARRFFGRGRATSA